ncbi:hypothetical protein PYW07_010210 [Mythimna separata]|uniref:BEN domain-containing protein n=1 Tax=Mythimna separata TaxID=271217 RepID=A0AAD8DRH7_MYTSE|nr:hypothetical protein PYW07_010210 [Mythimna separata]
MISYYDVVNVDTRTFNETGLQPRESIMIRVMDIQNEKVKNASLLSGREVRTGTLETSSYSPIPKVLDVRNDYSDSSSDSEGSPKVELNRFASTYTPQYEHQLSTSKQIRDNNNESSFTEPNVDEPQIEPNNPDYEENAIEEERQSNRGEQEANSSMNNAEPISNSNPLHVRRMSAQSTNDIGDEVPIGDGHAMVPVTVLTAIDWKSYTKATRLLLQAVFPRRVLAKSSLTGRPSPAFMGKPAKDMLDPLLVEDSIITVTDNCEVPV